MSIKTINYSISLLLYVVLFTIYYYPFISEGLLPGKIDSWFNLGIFKHYTNIYDSIISSSNLFIPNYPEGNVFLYGESSILSGFFFSFLNLFINNDLISYIAFYILIQSLNSFSFLLFVHYFFKTDLIFAFIGGLFFTFSAFNLAFYDNIVYSIWFPLFFSLYFLLKASRNNKAGHYFLFVTFFYAHLYFSVYNFFMGFIILNILMLTFCFANFKFVRNTLFITLFFSPLIIPFLYMYIFNSKIPLYFNEYITLDIISGMGFKFSNLSKSFQSNLIYGSGVPFAQDVNYYWTVGNLGFSSLILAIAGFYNSNFKLKVFSISLVLIGVILAFGPFWGEFKSISYYLYYLFPLLKQFKLIFKFYYLIHISLILLMIQGLLWLSSRFLFNKILLLFLIVFFLIENLPTKRTEYSTPFTYPIITAEDLNMLKKSSISTLFLPMCAPMFPQQNDRACFIEGREIEFKYLYWQANLKINMLNGANGTIPNNRMHLNQVFDDNNFIDAIYILYETHHLRFIIYDKKVNFSFNNPTLNYLTQNIEHYKELEDYVIFYL